MERYETFKLIQLSAFVVLMNWHIHCWMSTEKKKKTYAHTRARMVQDVFLSPFVTTFPLMYTAFISIIF